MSLDKTSVSIAAGSSGGLIGFCATVLTLVLTLKTSVVNQAALFWETTFLIFAIVAFELATEFYITAAWRSRTMSDYERWAFWGSVPYSLAMALLAVSIGLMFLALTDFVALAYLPPVLFLASWVALFAKRAKGEPMSNARWIIRASMVLTLSIGIALMIVLSWR